MLKIRDAGEIGESKNNSAKWKLIARNSTPRTLKLEEPLFVGQAGSRGCYIARSIRRLREAADWRAMPALDEGKRGLALAVGVCSALGLLKWVGDPVGCW